MAPITWPQAHLTKTKYTWCEPALRMFVSDLVTEIFTVTLLGISGLDEINYNRPPFLYAVKNTQCH